jgi:restriction system protein
MQVYQNDPRTNPVESQGYFLYKSNDPNVPLDQWTKVNDKPIPPTSDGHVQYRIPRAETEGINGIYVTAVNALGFESVPSKVIYPPRETSPKLVLKTLLEFRETTDEGQLIQAVTEPWFEILELLAKDPEAAFRIPDRKWQEIIAGAYHRARFDEVILTLRSGDYGRDVIAIKKGIGRIRVIEQVKAYKPDHLVTADDVRALAGVLQADGASKGFLSTTADFAPRLHLDPLINKYIPSQLELINGKKLLNRLMELRRH